MSGSVIGSLRGSLLARTVVPGSQPSVELLLEVNGVGYRVRTTSAVVAGIGAEGSEVFVYIYHVVREDSEMFYGFATDADRRIFEALISVHSVGPALALSVLETLTAEALHRAVVLSDADTICQVKGIGNKTAKRLIMELKSKLELPEDTVSATADNWESEPVNSLKSDVRSALLGLGYSPREINATMNRLPAILFEEGTVEGILREALTLMTENKSSIQVE
ncbi:MAG: Holliday junction branch migration protein RuvA [Acidimicrobiaceae bacterium]|nr:Holliday junction branch migration protein RuvA [Acidimicrobiaceae bacterium]